MIGLEKLFAAEETFQKMGEAFSLSLSLHLFLFILLSLTRKIEKRREKEETEESKKKKWKMLHHWIMKRVNNQLDYLSRKKHWREKKWKKKWIKKEERNEDERKDYDVGLFWLLEKWRKERESMRMKFHGIWKNEDDASDEEEEKEWRCQRKHYHSLPM